MHGNVWEWCLDEWHDSYADKPENLKKQGNEPWGGLIIGKNDNRYRIMRGGTWDGIGNYCRSAYRYRDVTDFRNSFLGFRLVL
jgi:formylglycine-generating enzyme required for sulfatase activity